MALTVTRGSAEAQKFSGDIVRIDKIPEGTTLQLALLGNILGDDGQLQTFPVFGKNFYSGMSFRAPQEDGSMKKEYPVIPVPDPETDGVPNLPELWKNKVPTFLKDFMWVVDLSDVGNDGDLSKDGVVKLWDIRKSVANRLVEIHDENAALGGSDMTGVVITVKKDSRTSFVVNTPNIPPIDVSGYAPPVELEQIREIKAFDTIQKVGAYLNSIKEDWLANWGLTEDQYPFDEEGNVIPSFLK